MNAPPEPTAALPATSFNPHVVLSGAVGVAMMFAFTSFIGFESAALYGEETRNPKRSVPLATYISVVLIAVFYALPIASGYESGSS